MRTCLLLLAVASPLRAQNAVHAPVLSGSVLPGLSALGASAAAPVLSPSAGLAAPRAVAPILPSAPVLSAPSLVRAAAPAAAAAAPAAAAAAPAAAAAASAEPLAAASAELAKAPGRAAPVLDRLFEARVSPAAAAGPVAAGVPSYRPSLLAAPRNFAASEEPAPPAPQRPAWKTAGLYALRTAGFLGALAAGFRVGDMVYLGLSGFGLFGAALAAAVLGGSAWLLGRAKDRSTAGRLVVAALYASGGFVVLGQMAWDAFHSPLALLLGVPAGVFLALLSAGLVRRRS